MAKNESVKKTKKKKRPSRLPAAAADQGGGHGHAALRRQEGNAESLAMKSVFLKSEKESK